MSGFYELQFPSDWAAMPVNDNGDTIVLVLWPIAGPWGDDGEDSDPGVQVGWVSPRDLDTLTQLAAVSVEMGGTACWYDGTSLVRQVSDFDG